MHLQFDKTTDSCKISFPYDASKVKLMKILGGEFDGKTKTWEVKEPVLVETLARLSKADGPEATLDAGALRDYIQGQIDESQTSVDTPIKLEVPPGRRLKHAQYSAIRWVLRHPATLEGDPMGSGKTIICAVAANHLKSKRVLVVCRASAKANWRREWRAWNMMAYNGETTVGYAMGSFWPGTDVVIVNHDIIDRFRTKYKYDNKERKYLKDENGDLIIEKVGQIDEVDWDMVVVDECHRIKGLKAIRTRAIIGHRSRGTVAQVPIPAPRKIAMSGTPLLNRPHEIWPSAYWLWPKSFPSSHLFGMKYCGGQKKGKFGWNFTGASNEKELNARLRLLGMIARPKSITHKDIPTKMRSIVEFEVHGLSFLFEQERAMAKALDDGTIEFKSKATAAVVFKEDQEFRNAMRRLGDSVVEKKAELRRIRRDVAMASISYFVADAKECLKEHKKVALYCWHRNVAEALKDAFPNAAMIHGGVPAEARQSEVDRFQRDDECRVFIGTIAAAGESITLTAATCLNFVEFSDVPGDMLQAEDRIHRIGQKEEIHIRYLCPEGSAWAVMAGNIITKAEIIERCVGVIRERLMEIPVSLSDDDMPASNIPYPDLELLADQVQTYEDAPLREKMRMVAQGKIRGKLHKMDQVVAARLCNVVGWSELQQAMAEHITRRYQG